MPDSPAARARVALVSTRDGHVTDQVREAMELARWRDFITPGANVALKVNLGWDLFLPGAVTAPWVVEGVIQALQGYAGSITVVESDQVLVSAERALVQTHIAAVCRRQGVPWVNMSRGRFRRVHLAGAKVFHQVEVPEILLNSEVITIPVMKTHNKTKLTGAIKNQWGCLNKLRHNFHLVLDDALVEINRIVRPRFAVMDATVGLEGDGPKSGRPRVMDLVLASGDLVALDSVQALIMGLDPARITHLQRCAAAGLGLADPARIDVVGAALQPAQPPFTPARHNLVSWVEQTLRTSPLKPLVFDTPLFEIFCQGAILFYYLWYARTGRKLRDDILYGTPYGAQWTDTQGGIGGHESSGSGWRASGPGDGVAPPAKGRGRDSVRAGGNPGRPGGVV